MDAHFLDAFGRHRVSQAMTLCDWQAQYDEGPLVWGHKTAGTASAAHRAAEASVRLAVGADKDDEIVRQTREHIRHQPGKSQLIFLILVMGTTRAGVRREVD